MKNRIVTAGVIVVALMLPVAAHAQVIAGTIVGGALGGPAGAIAGAMIGGINAAAFNDYVATHTYPSYYYAGNVVVGGGAPRRHLLSGASRLYGAGVLHGAERPHGSGRSGHGKDRSGYQLIDYANRCEERPGIAPGFFIEEFAGTTLTGALKRGFVAPAILAGS